ncbi:hypothetical protein C1645_811786 [Glomus cerebriforme]|uniref:Uncharacterized protein n=1 Tax=Glomus cerebriforme TaxID=658196 RepID=A0A397TR19_9GLOM|nr:hypothetical protein C1645_862702 [Glomus cerebriforme]RIA99055.1 hypothetical protein C1645_811786 [Glomus cerebriforme]
MNKFIKLTISAIVVLLVVGTLSSTTFADTRAVKIEARQEKTSSSIPTPSTPASGIPPPAVPPASVNTAKTTPTPSPSASGATPSGTGTLIPAFSSLISSGLPTQPSAAPPYKSPESTGASTPAKLPSAANKVEYSLFGIIIAGVFGLFL